MILFMCLCKRERKHATGTSNENNTYDFVTNEAIKVYEKLLLK